MMRNKHITHGISYLRALLLLLSFIFIAPAGLRAGDKTPPCYPEGDREGSATAQGPDAAPLIKDFSSLFKRPAASGTGQKTPPYYDEGERKEGSRSTSKPEGEDLAKQTPPINDQGFQTQEYVVQEGDWLAKILREKGMIQEKSLPELLSLLRKLNSSLHNLDMIQPGEKIVILVKVVPETGSVTETGRKPVTETGRKPKFETYRVKRGDTLIRVAMERYDLSKGQFNREYMRLFAACNPSVKDPNNLLVGQTINLPRYPPEHVETAERLPFLRDLEKSPHQVALMKQATPIERPQLPQPTPPPRSKTEPPPPAPAKARPKPAEKDTSPPPQPVWPASLKPVELPGVYDSAPSERAAGQTTIIITDGLGTIVSRMGEEWIQSGEHVIPMKSGGHIKLKADSYPIVRVHKGITVIVDMHNTLPEKMARVLESTWASYRVVQLSPSDDLRSALDKILNACNYPKIVKGGSPLTLGGNIPVSITGDLIVTPPPAASGKGPGFIVINLTDGRGQGTPRAIKNYLRLIGVEVIEYPPADEGPEDSAALSAAQTATDPAALIKAVLDLRGLPFSTHVNIPAYATHNKDFKFTVQADFYLEIWGGRYIIDVGGLGPDVASLLKENGISVLSLAQEKEPVEMVSRLLKFLDIRFERGPHSFMAKRGDTSRNVTLTLSGVTFYDQKGASVFATPLDLPPEIVVFLSQRGYKVLVISPSGPSGSGRA